MQDKESLEEAEEALTGKAETSSISSDQKDLSDEKREGQNEVQEKKEQTKEKDHKDRFAFRRMRQPKKDKKNPSRFEGDGVSFKGKIIGVEDVCDAKGDKMCQDTMQRLKINIRNAGTHKRKVNIFVSLQGIKIKDDKSAETLYHHPVPLISFISQDITDARAFGYIFGSSGGGHQFIAIKTEKPAFPVVIALRDLFETVLFMKQEKIDQVKEIRGDHQNTESSQETESTEEKKFEWNDRADTSSEGSKGKEENIYNDVILPQTQEISIQDEISESLFCTEKTSTIDGLLGLQNEVNKLQEDIEQIELEAATFNIGINLPEKDPFDTSFVLGPKMDTFPPPLPTPVLLTSASCGDQTQSTLTEHSSPTAVSVDSTGDKYAAFSELTGSSSVFENTSVTPGFDSSPFGSPEPIACGFDATKQQSSPPIPELQELEEEIAQKTVAPPKPPRGSKTASSDPSVFADLDPLGKDRPYKDKAEFFQDLKKPPKKVLNDLVDKSSSSGEETVSKVFDTNLSSSPLVFPSGLEAFTPALPFVPPRLSGLSSSLPVSFPNMKLSVAQPQNGHIANNPFNPFENTDRVASPSPLPPSKLTSRASEPAFPVLPSPPSNILPRNSIKTGLSYLGKTPPSTTILTVSQQQFTVSKSAKFDNSGFVSSNYTISSSPIPIPSRQQPLMHNTDATFSNGSLGSPSYSKSPVSFSTESPTRLDYFGQNFADTDSSSPMGHFMKNGHHIYSKGNNYQKNLNSENLSDFPIGSHLLNNGNNYSDSTISPPLGISPPVSKTTNSTSLNGVSRPRPRGSLSKGISLPNGLTAPLSSHSSSVTAIENEIISIENMQSIANVLLSNGHKIRKNSLPFTESHKNFTSFSENTIFAKKNDPFADDFFCSLPKKVTGHLAKTEIQDHV